MKRQRKRRLKDSQWRPNHGYTRIFTSLLELTPDMNDLLDQYKQVITCGNELGMKTILDINPELFEQ